MEIIDLVSVYQAAKILDRAPQTIRHWETTGKLRGFRVDGKGGPRVFLRRDVEELARELERKSA